jgi:hypothetical protein
MIILYFFSKEKYISSIFELFIKDLNLNSFIYLKNVKSPKARKNVVSKEVVFKKTVIKKSPLPDLNRGYLGIYGWLFLIQAPLVPVRQLLQPSVLTTKLRGGKCNSGDLNPGHSVGNAAY